MPQQLTRNCLSEHDRKVLDSIFNPLELTSATVQNGGAHDAAAIQCDVDLVDIEEANAIGDAAIQESKRLELQAVKLAEVDGELERALNVFEQALQMAPQRVSLYNNRAQAMRLAGRDEEAMQDLTKAIEGCKRELKTKCHALCQRGVLHRKKEDLDAARRDFEAAADLGSQFAKNQLIEINPFAALCNQMLRQAFEQLQ